LTSPPDKPCSNSRRSLRYANSHHIPDGTRGQCQTSVSASPPSDPALVGPSGKRAIFSTKVSAKIKTL
jgi:hypothetical protein